MSACEKNVGVPIFGALGRVARSRRLLAAGLERVGSVARYKLHGGKETKGRPNEKTDNQGV